MSGGVVDYANAGFITEQDGEAMSETPYSIVHHGVAYVLADALEKAEADNAALREQVEAFRREQIARSKIDPVTRLHNLCDGLAESRHESPYDQASWDLADADNKQLRARAERAEAERDALRKMVNAADEMRLCLHKPIKNYADDLLDAIVAYDHARLESDAALLAGKEGK